MTRAAGSKDREAGSDAPGGPGWRTGRGPGHEVAAGRSQGGGEALEGLAGTAARGGACAQRDTEKVLARSCL